MKRRILLSLATLILVGALATTATRALLSDEETSTGNTFTAGAIDLGVDNHSYYNGNECVDVGTEGQPNYVWQGTEPYPEPGTPCETSWNLDYDIQHDDQGATQIRKFFAFDDLKPGDWGEDTISLHVDNNDAYLCADVTLTSNDDNGITEPEGEDGDTTDGQGNGELADAITFYWWADDGDNVYESDEQLLPAGPLGALGVDETATIALADITQNIWNDGLAPGALPAGGVVYIGKAWCFGDGTGLTPYSQDGDGNPDGGPSERPVQCNGAPLNNLTQTDSATMDITFRAVQARHNDNFACNRLPTTLTVHKIVDNSAGGDKTVDSWDYIVDNNVGTVDPDVPTEVEPGTYHVNEAGDPGQYIQTYGEDCTNGTITLEEGEQKTCTIINTFVPVTVDLTVNKIVEGGGPLAANDFDLFVDDTQVSNGIAEAFAPGAHIVSEQDDSGLYTSTIGGDDCDSEGSVTLVEDNPASCTITNTYSPATITVDKVVQFSSAVLNVSPGDFDLVLDDGVHPPVHVTDEVAQNDLPVGTYTVSESYTGGLSITYDAQFSDDCTDNGQTGTIVVGPNGVANCHLLNVISPN